MLFPPGRCDSHLLGCEHFLVTFWIQSLVYSYWTSCPVTNTTLSYGLLALHLYGPVVFWCHNYIAPTTEYVSVRFSWVKFLKSEMLSGSCPQTSCWDCCEGDWFLVQGALFMHFLPKFPSLGALCMLKVCTAWDQGDMALCCAPCDLIRALHGRAFCIRAEMLWLTADCRLYSKLHHGGSRWCFGLFTPPNCSFSPAWGAYPSSKGELESDMYLLSNVPSMPLPHSALISSTFHLPSCGVTQTSGLQWCNFSPLLCHWPSASEGIIALASMKICQCISRIGPGHSSVCSTHGWTNWTFHNWR